MSASATQGGHKVTFVSELRHLNFITLFLNIQFFKYAIGVSVFTAVQSKTERNVFE